MSALLQSCWQYVFQNRYVCQWHECFVVDGINLPFSLPSPTLRREPLDAPRLQAVDRCFVDVSFLWMCHNSFRQRYVTFLSILKGSIKLLPGKQINRVTVNKNPTDATVCRYLFTARLLYLFRVSQHPSSDHVAGK